MLQTALITHADNELGKAIAVACAQKEMKVLIAGADKETLYDLDEEIQEMGSSSIALVADLKKAGEAEKLHQIAALNFGVLDMVLHLPYAQMPFQPYAIWQTTNQHLSELLPICEILSQQAHGTVVCLNFVNQVENSLMQAIQKNAKDGLNNLRQAFPTLDFLNVDVEIETLNEKTFEALMDAIFYIVEAPESIKIDDFKIFIE